MTARLLAPIKVRAYACVQIRETSMRSSKSINRRALLAGSAAAVVAMPAIVRAQGGQLKVGVLLPRSGVQAVIGRDCQRAVELTPPIPFLI